MTAAYDLAKVAPIRSTVACPTCGKKFVKTVYNKVFCSNNRTSPGKASCKDKYWNKMQPVTGPFDDQHPFDMDDGYYDENGD